jgi:hypothetical protein
MNKKWEYNVQNIPKPDEVIFALDRLGNDGWELIYVSGPVFYFKREKKA